MGKLAIVCGARPNFIKVAPLLAACRRHANLTPLLVHTGQHYDADMSDRFFRDLQLPQPDVQLAVGSGSHARQTAEIMTRFEPLLREHHFEWVTVVGDVNSTLAAALVAAKLGVRVAHVEAGLRSFDRSMPEEINRVLTDALSDLLLVSERSGLDNLRREGVPDDKVHFVGNVMIDALRAHLSLARRSNILAELGLRPRRYNVVTLHRPSNVDDPEVLARVLAALGEISEDLPTIFPVHPRTAAKLAELAAPVDYGAKNGLRFTKPLGYLDFLRLISEAAVVLTDSGGIQEETTVLGVWCLTLRDNTERPVTITQGTNTLVGTDPARILVEYRRCRATPVPQRPPPEKWDGHAAERIAAILAQRVR